MSSYGRGFPVAAAVLIDSAECQPSGLRMPRPRSISGKRSPANWKSFASCSRLTATVPSCVTCCSHVSAASRIASSTSGAVTAVSCQIGQPDAWRRRTNYQPTGP